MMIKVLVFVVVFAFTAISYSNGLKCWGAKIGTDFGECTLGKQGPSKDDLKGSCKERDKGCKSCKRVWSDTSMMKTLALNCDKEDKTGCNTIASQTTCYCKKDLCNAAMPLKKNDFGFVLVVGLLLVGGMY